MIRYARIVARQFEPTAGFLMMLTSLGKDFHLQCDFKFLHDGLLIETCGEQANIFTLLDSIKEKVAGLAPNAKVISDLIYSQEPVNSPTVPQIRESEATL